jgi:CheY-like chemotaxis protein
VARRTARICVVQTTWLGYLYHGQGESPPFRLPLAEGDTPIPAKILCVDDEPAPLEARCAMLQKAGYHVVAAGSGREATRLFSAERFDLVVLDYWMADMDGLDVAEGLKRTNPKVLIIMLSGYRSILDEQIGRVDTWLVKGESEPEDLLSTISELLGRDGNS